MCGRYDSFLPPEFIAQLFSTVNTLPNLKPTWNMAPTKDAVRRGPDAVFHEGPEESAQPINARSETVATSDIFRAAFAKRRCLVPTAAYYGATIPMGSGPIDKAGQAKFPKVLISARAVEGKRRRLMCGIFAIRIPLPAGLQAWGFECGQSRGMALWILRLTSSRGNTIVAQHDKVSGSRAPTFLPDPLRGAGRLLCLESASQGVVMPEIVQSARSIGSSPSQKYRPTAPRSTCRTGNGRAAQLPVRRFGARWTSAMATRR